MARDVLTRAALGVLSLAVAGCGTMTGPVASGNAAFTISTSAVTTNTNGQIALRAELPSGEPAPVRWSIDSGTNAASLGEGDLNAKGVYTAPGSLSSDEISVRVQATLAGDPTISSFATLLVHPGFVQPLLPQNLALTPGASAEVTAQIAEVNTGMVRWSLESTPDGDSATTGALGTLSASDCQRSAEQYTTCTVTYTAPTATPIRDVYVVASVNGSRIRSPLHVLVNNRGIVSNPVANQNIQTGMASLGTSGGNDGDFDTYEDKDGNSYVADCCGGTLGALVQDDQRNQYILSNNHVLAESDQARVGDTIDQPGLMDGACTPLTRPGSTLHPLATLKYFVPLQSSQSNVDAALATAAPGAVDPSGSILQLGAPNASQALGAAPPMAGRGETLSAANLGMDVAKSGRTTGLTCSSVDAVALTVKVDYYRDCAETQPYTTKTYVNQIGIGGSHFTDSGDSGALVLDASNAEAIGLYFAGGTDGDGHGLSVVNPIGDVLNELSTQSGTHLSLVGTNTPHAIACLRYDPAVPLDQPHLTPAAQQRAQSAAQGAGAALHGAGILGVAPGSSLDTPGNPAVIVYVDRADAAVPQTIDGLRTQVIVTDAASVARGTAQTMPSLEPGIHLSAAALAGATAVEQTVASRLMSDSAIFGVGVTQSLDNPAEAALLVLVDIGRNPQSMPATMGGLRVRYLRLHRFHTTRARDTEGNPASACSLKGLRPVH